MDTSDGPPRDGRGGYRSNYRGRGRSNSYNRSSGWYDDSYNGGGYRGSGGRGSHGGYYNQGYQDNDGGRYYDGGRGGYTQGFRGGRGQQRGKGYFGGQGRSNNQYYSSRGRQRGRGPDRGPPPPPEPLPADVELLAELEGHTKKVTAMAVDAATVQLFTGGFDGTLRVWSCESGQCTHTDDLGGQISSMLIEGGFLFVGLKTASNAGHIRAWNVATMAQYTLEGHSGEVYCLAAAGGMLFSGGQDQSIRVWKFDPAKNAFECTALLQAVHGGHQYAVSRMVVSGQYMFSADFGGTIKVWDLASGQCVQSMEKAHSGTAHPAIMGMLVWEGHLVSSSLDGRIKIWEPSPDSASIISTTPVYTFPPEDASTSKQRSRERQEDLNGVLAMSGVTDALGKSVLMVSYNSDMALRLFEMPTFQERGALAIGSSVRALAAGPGGLLIAGDEQGKVKVWRWRPPPM